MSEELKPWSKAEIEDRRGKGDGCISMLMRKQNEIIDFIINDLRVDVFNHVHSEFTGKIT